MYWMYGRDLAHTIQWISTKFGTKPDVEEANILSLKAGYNFGDTTDVFSTQFEVGQAAISPGTYRQITGNQAPRFGFVTASQLSGLDLFLGSYPITPASDILHELSRSTRNSA